MSVSLFFSEREKIYKWVKNGMFFRVVHTLWALLSRVHSFVPLPVMHFFKKVAFANVRYA